MNKPRKGMSIREDILQELFKGPAFGLEMADRLFKLGYGALWIDLEMYPTLRELENEGVIESYEESGPPERQGGSRRYYRVVNDLRNDVGETMNEVSAKFGWLSPSGKFGWLSPSGKFAVWVKGDKVILSPPVWPMFEVEEARMIADAIHAAAGKIRGSNEAAPTGGVSFTVTLTKELVDHFMPMANKRGISLQLFVEKILRAAAVVCDVCDEVAEAMAKLGD